MWRAPLPWLLLGHSLTLHLYRRLLLLLLLLCACLHLHLGQGRLLKGCLRLLLAQLGCQLIQLQLLARASTLQGSAVLVREPMELEHPAVHSKQSRKCDRQLVWTRTSRHRNLAA